MMTRFLPQCLQRYVELLLSDGLGSEVSCPDAACPQRGRLLDVEVAPHEPHNLYNTRVLSMTQRTGGRGLTR